MHISTPRIRNLALTTGQHLAMRHNCGKIAIQQDLCHHTTLSFTDSQPILKLLSYRQVLVQKFSTRNLPKGRKKVTKSRNPDNYPCKD